MRIFLLAFAADRITKIFAAEYLTIFRNRGVAFSMFQGAPLGFLLGIFAITMIIFFVFYKHVKVPPKWTALFFAGAAGNAFDRLFYGYVIDWINVWLYINLADIFLCVGALGIFFLAESRKRD